ncbi:MAG: hypothetical protein ABEJ68_09650 [Halobacteriaceae archaeon]
MNNTQVVAGLALVVVGAALMFATGVAGSTLPVLVASVGALALAAGTLLVGTSKSRQV